MLGGGIYCHPACCPRTDRGQEHCRPPVTPPARRLNGQQAGIGIGGAIAMLTCDVCAVTWMSCRTWTDISEEAILARLLRAEPSRQLGYLRACRGCMRRCLRKAVTCPRSDGSLESGAIASVVGGGDVHDRGRGSPHCQAVVLGLG